MDYKCSYAYCFVPKCKNTTINNPNILYFNVPLNINVRLNWYKRVRREASILKPLSRSRMTCCEDHFCVSIMLLLINVYYVIQDKIT